MAETKATRKIVYALSVEVTVPLSDDPDDADFPTLEGATSQRFKRDIERSVISLLTRLEWECTNVEVMDFTVEDE
jgi:hypothetical protein